MSAEPTCAWGAYLDQMQAWLDETEVLTVETVDELSEPPQMPAGVSIPTTEVSRAMSLVGRFQTRVLALEELRDATGRQLTRVKDLPDVSDPIPQSIYLDRSA